MNPSAMTVTIEIPALDHLVAYFKERDRQQLRELIEQVRKLTEKLHASNQDLSAAVKASPTP